MKKKIFQMAICLLAVTGNSFAQQWLGSQTSTGAIYRDGSISLGNTSPIKKITIKTSELGDGAWVASSGTTNLAMLSNMGLANWNGLTQSGDNMILWAGSNINQADAGGLVIGPWTSSNLGMRLTPGGNIGVGIINPHKKITIKGTELGDGVWVTSNGAPQIAMLSNLGLGYWNGLTQSGDNMLLWGGSNINQADAGGLVIGPWTSSNLGMRLTPGGNIGVGIINPHKKITIKGTELGDGVWVTSNGAPQIAMLSNLGQGYWNGLTQSGDNMLLWGGSNINQADAGALVIGPWTSASEGLRILPSGNVGIGTASPGSFKLAVEGKIGAREVRVTNTNPWPDYVFTPEYDLLPLKQVETYIQLNGHLPDVPTEKEIHKEGYDLSKMDATLLKKIEELTLHVIELNKKVEQLTRENKSLQSTVK